MAKTLGYSDFQGVNPNIFTQTIDLREDAIFIEFIVAYKDYLKRGGVDVSNFKKTAGERLFMILQTYANLKTQELRDAYFSGLQLGGMNELRIYGESHTEIIAFSNKERTKFFSIIDMFEYIDRLLEPRTTPVQRKANGGVMTALLAQLPKIDLEKAWQGVDSSI